MSTKENNGVFASIKISYDRNWILPLEKGLDLMRAIASGEVLKDRHGMLPEILPLDEEITLTLVPESKIKEIKMAKVLDVNGGSNAP